MTHPFYEYNRNMMTQEYSRVQRVKAFLISKDSSAISI